MAAMMTPGTRMSRDDSGLLVFSLPWYSYFLILFLNKLQSGNGSASVSVRNMVPTSQAISSNTEQMAQGRKKGYFLRNSLDPNNCGNCSTGFESDPPILDPNYGGYFQMWALSQRNRTHSSSKVPCSFVVGYYLPSESLISNRSWFITKHILVQYPLYRSSQPTYCIKH